MLNIAICDDEKRELASTLAAVQEYITLHPELELSVAAFSSGEELLSALGGRQFDLYILDVLMPNINGIGVGHAIRRQDEGAYIIYLTSSPEFAVESYSVEARAYILKPFSKKQFFDALDKGVKQVRENGRRQFPLETPSGLVAIPYNSIVYLEYSGHKLLAHLTDAVVESKVYRQSANALLEPICATGDFVRISVSFAVNMRHIARMTSKECQLANGEQLSISRNYGDARKAFMDYMLERSF